MSVIDNATTEELLQSLLGSTAKAQNEIKSAQADIDKAHRRIKFNIMLVHRLMERQTNGFETNS